MHVPRNPHHNCTCKEEPEIFAPATVKPNFIKKGSHSKFTTSAPKVNVVGGYQGMSTFSINPSQDKKVWMRKETTSNQILALRRKEIYECAVKMDSEEDIRNLIKDEPFESIYQSEVENHGGTYIDLNDVTHNWDLLQREVKGANRSLATDENSAQENENENEEESTTCIAKLIMNPIHNSKSNPMKMMHINNKQSEFKLINSLVEIVSNCRPIHLKMISNYLSTKSPEIEGILKLCKNKSAWSADYAEQSYNALIKLLKDY